MQQTDNILIVSIKPKYIEQIKSGNKLIELRKSAPQKVSKKDFMLIYSTYPEMSLIGYCQIGDILKETPKNIWDSHHEKLGVSKKEFSEYYSNSKKAVAIELVGFEELEFKVPLKEIKKDLPNFSPPQTFKYFNNIDFIEKFSFVSRNQKLVDRLAFSS